MGARPQVQGWHKRQMSSRALLPTALAVGPAALGWVKLVKMLRLQRQEPSTRPGPSGFLGLAWAIRFSRLAYQALIIPVPHGARLPLG